MFVNFHCHSMEKRKHDWFAKQVFFVKQIAIEIQPNALEIAWNFDWYPISQILFGSSMKLTGACFGEHKQRTCFWHQILDQKQEGIATQKREHNQKHLFQFVTCSILNVSQNIQCDKHFGKMELTREWNLKDILVYEQSFHHFLTNN